MPVKRKRANDSTSQHEVSVTTTFSAKIRRAGAATETPRPKIFTIGSPAKVAARSNHLRIGEFLERCHFCKRLIDRKSDVYMYRNFCAFCSPECREFQINLDNAKKKSEGEIYAGDGQCQA